MTGLVSLGRLTIRHREIESDVRSLIAATRDPLRVKIEITHPWGKPLAQILVEGDWIEAVSFAEQRFYRGRLTRGLLPGLFPTGLSQEQLWSVARGFPRVPDHEGISASGRSALVLHQNGGRPAGTIRFNDSSGLPESLQYPGDEIAVSYSNYQNREGVWYAGKVTVEAQGGEAALVLEPSEIQLNREVPEEIFRVVIPAGYQEFSPPEEGRKP